MVGEADSSRLLSNPLSISSKRSLISLEREELAEEEEAEEEELALEEAEELLERLEEELPPEVQPPKARSIAMAQARANIFFAFMIGPP